MTTSPTRGRQQAVDALRGLVMIIMALDHTRDFFHAAAMTGSPTDLATTTPATFLTRWITHLCAPVFVLLAGTSARLWLERPGRTRAQLSRYLATRGAWLILVEVLVMRVAFDMTFSLGYPVLLITLFALGASMIVLAALVHVPVRVLAPLAALVILSHNAFDSVRADQLGAVGWLWTLLHQPGAILLGGPVLIVGYPVIPWFAVMALGYCLGELLLRDAHAWRPVVLRTGVTMIVAFLLVRALNVYGDPSPRATYPSAVLTALSFLNTTKYPASLSFLLMTLGPGLVLLTALGARTFGPRNVLLVFGRVPLFYYVVHFFLLHLLLIVVLVAQHGGVALSYALHPTPAMGGPKELLPAPFGFPLWAVYAAWATVVLAMYPLCRWYGALRARRTDWWLSYL